MVGHFIPVNPSQPPSRTGASVFDAEMSGHFSQSALVAGASVEQSLKAAPHWTWHASCGFAGWSDFSTFGRTDLGGMPAGIVGDLLTG